ncbi:N-acetylmuramidase family protein [Taibaiella lutea]|uniref:N-acetylmuramidase family protein n=1 Tax=Taibaiella lutea TaxID=2608001 RepID=A0A5M6CP06_9BACT|nr:N-acetylmuramidase domain-containing protein [Taibaiella lutea]KAA5536746.1 N-acetylmuramidase family protein [Taibaiella lutea]
MEALGYSSISEMWDDFKKGEFQQIAALVKFIRIGNRLFSALKSHDWDKVAKIYNGAAYKEMTVKWKREPYDVNLRKAYEKFEI